MKKSWPIVKLGETVRDLTANRALTVKSDDLIVDPTIQSATHKISAAATSRGFQVKVQKRILIKPGDLVFSRLHTQNGAFAFSEGTFQATGTFVPLEIRTDRADPRFLFWALHKFVPSLSASDTVGRETYKTDDILALEIPLPPLAEQRRIVARIEELAAHIHEAQSLRQQAAEEAEALFWRTRAVLFGELANHFASQSLGELISMTSGEGLTSSEMDENAPYPVYGGGGLNGHHSRYMFEDPTIVIGRVGARCGCVFVTEPKAWVTDNALYLTDISEKLFPPYLTHALATLDLRQQANQAAQPVVSQKKINPMQIPVPPLPAQRRIVAELDALQAEVDRLKALQAETAAELAALLPSLLDRAFKGEL